MNVISLFPDYLRYRLGAKTKYHIHSPFVYELFTKVISDKKNYPAYQAIETLREQLLLDETIIRIIDLGAGSQSTNSPEQKIKDICKRAEKNKHYGQLLYRLADYFRPAVIIDLGTSLGITTLYLAKGSPFAKVITVEGCPRIAAAARKNFEKLGAGNIELVNGNFDQVLPGILKDKKALSGLFFFDGNHRKEPTLHYFELCLACAGNDSVFIFDDIRWSAEMKEAWEIIKKNPRVTVTIDLFFMGLVFIRREQAKEHFVIRF